MAIAFISVFSLITLACASSQDQRPATSMAPPPGFGSPGVHIPMRAARSVTIAHLATPGTEIIDIRDYRTQQPLPSAGLVTAASTVLVSGLRLHSDCSEHLRIGDAIQQGLVRSTESELIVVELSDGATAIIAPGQAIYFGDYVVVSNPESSNLLATHHWECWCTCDAGSYTSQVSYNCGNCGDEGNQCRSGEGSDCQFDPDGDGPEQPVMGTLSDCREVLVQNAGGPE